MNKRDFIKICSIATIGTIIIPNIFAKRPSLCEDNEVKYQSYFGGDYINILKVEELKKYGIRSAIFSANCVDNNGVFSHECGFNDSKKEPFVRKSYVLHCLPKIRDGKKSSIYPTIEKLRAGVCLDEIEYSISKIIAEIKEKMEYVCVVAYVPLPCLCGSKLCADHYVPMVMGLSKQRYKLYIEQLNS